MTITAICTRCLAPMMPWTGPYQGTGGVWCPTCATPATLEEIQATRRTHHECERCGYPLPPDTVRTATQELLSEVYDVTQRLQAVSARVVAAYMNQEAKP